ncbi:MAG TPA: prephenate dehydrogenase/arogenate dehydrogenase family protein, partial [Gemmatimonadales bacterium]|nr:prephenate dehydrogenase/arogenate dehydrogenase family protein [Gemmatimonadales bacterium]
MRPDSLAIIGLGALGGSLAWQATRAGIPRVVGYAKDRSDGVQALKAGALHEVADRAELAVRGAELVVLAVPFEALRTLLPRIAKALPPTTWLTDTIPLKGPVQEVVREAGLLARWAGSHLLWELEGRGFAAARPEGLRGRVVYVSADPAGAGALREVMHFWETVYGAEGVQMDLADHDRVLSWTHLLPRLLAVVAAGTLGEAGLAARSRDPATQAATRLAATDPEELASLLLAARAPV